MKCTLTLLAAVCAASLTSTAGAAELRVTRSNEVTPDKELLEVVQQLRTLSAKGDKKNIRKVEAFFAPEVKTFTRSLDPFQPWHPLEGLHGKYLEGVANVMVEQGEPIGVESKHDYRIDAMQYLANYVLSDGTFGSLPEVPGAICTPAAYQVDRKAALAFARKFELDAHSLRFYRDDIVLLKKAEGKKGKVVPAYTMIMFDYDPNAPKDWGYFESAGGIKGYMKDRDDTLGLSQNHVCFTKVKGKYRISGLFGYGL